MVTKSRNCKKKNKKTCKRKPVRKKSRRTRKKSRRRTRKKNKKKNQKKGKKKNRKKRKRKYKFGPNNEPYMYDNITEALQNDEIIGYNLDTAMMGLQVAIQQRQAQAQAQLKDIIKSLEDHIEDINRDIDDSQEKEERIEALETSAKVLKEEILPTIQQELTEDNYISELENIPGIGKGTLERIEQILKNGKISKNMIYSRRQREELSSRREGDREQ